MQVCAAMSIPSLFSTARGVVVVPSGSCCAGVLHSSSSNKRAGWKPSAGAGAGAGAVALLRIPSFRGDGKGAGVTTACAVPCESAVDVVVPGNVGFERVGLESSSVLQCVQEVLVFHEGRSPELIRAAAYLRALSFYTYPEGRTEEALKLHRKMKTDDEFTALTSKVAGLEQGYKRIVCILALYPLSCLDDRSIVDLHPALKVVFANGEEHVLVGSLDLNQGKILPGEIVGNKPEGPNADRERGYLSNVCVAPRMRQRGIGVALLQHAQKIAQHWGINSLYVHVVATNEAAVKLYNKCGFDLEKEESASDARRQARPRRSLLHKLM